MQEIGIRQLQFRLHEVKEFYEKLSPTSNHSIFFYRQVLRITEGRALGRRLISLTGQSDDRHWQAKDSSVMSPVISSYLIHGILSNLSPSTRDFLIRTSVLKRLTPDNCNQLLDRIDSEEVLIDIEKRGLFINRLEDSHLSYRYHTIFLLALQNEMHRYFSKDAIMEMYIKAAHILYEQGDYQANIELAIKGKLFIVVDQWIEENLVNIFLTKQTDAFLRWVLILRKNSFEVHVETLAMYAFTLVLQYEMEKAASIVRELDRRNEKTDWKNEARLEDALLILEVVKVFMLFTQSRPTEKKVLYLQNKIYDNPFTLDSRWKQVPIIYNHFEPHLLRTSLGNRGKLYSIEQLTAFDEILQNDKFLAHNIAGNYHGLQAEVLYEMNLLVDSERHIEQAIEYAFRHNDAGLSVPMYIVQAKIDLANGQYIKAQARLDYAIESTPNISWQYIDYDESFRLYSRGNL